MMLDIDGYSCAGPCLSILLLNRREKGDKKANNTLKGRKRDGKVETEKKENIDDYSICSSSASHLSNYINLR